MNRATLTLALLTAVSGLVLGGCFEHELKLEVAPNGTGMIKEHTYFSAQTLAMLAGMKGAMAEGMGVEDSEVEEKAPAPADPNGPNPFIAEMIDEEEFKARAKEFGEDVKYKSAKPVKLPDGREGVEVVYTFTDVSKVRIPLDPEMPGEDMEITGPGMGMGGELEEAEQPEEKKEYAKLLFTKGIGQSPARLTVLLPHEEDEAGAATTAPAGPQLTPEEKAMQMAGMQMMAGLRLRILVGVKGKITKTNAGFVSDDRTTVTLLDMNFDEVIRNPKLMEKMAALGEMKSMTAAREKLQDPDLQKALKMETAEKVSIEFK
jgi:hypothetical protein